MAYLARCQLSRSIPTISKIITGSSPRILVSQKGAQSLVKNYNSLVNHVKRSGIAAAKPVNQSCNKLGQILTPFVSQIRASSHGDHVKLWQMERIVSAAFILLLPGVLLLQNAIVDIAFSTLLVMHAHWGLEAIILDYARPAVVGPVLPKVLFAALYALSAITLAGLLALAYNGPGVGGAVKKFWAVGQQH